MEESKVDRVIRLVQKLMERTVDRGFTPAEEVAAAARVQRLLQEHQLSIFDVESRRFDEKVTEERVELGAQLVHAWVSDLATAMGTAHDCQVVFWHTWEAKEHRRKTVIRFIGHTSDAKVARYLYDVLSRRLMEMADAEGRANGYRHAQLIKYRSQYITAAAYTIQRRIEDEKRAGMATATGTALVEVKSAEVERWVNENVPGLKPMRASKRDCNPEALRDGKRAGESLDLKKGLEDDSQPREALPKPEGGQP